jgi:hypothetical protein
MINLTPCFFGKKVSPHAIPHIQKIPFTQLFLGVRASMAYFLYDKSTWIQKGTYLPPFLHPQAIFFPHLLATL